jgi:1,4-alpha-glucan branching enzyme
MIKQAALWILFACPCIALAQESINPSITPWFFSADTEITVTYDVTGTPLANLSEAFAWVWIPGKSIDSKYNVNPANGDPTKTNNVKFQKSVSSGKTLFSLTFVPSSLFVGDISSETQFGILLKGNDWSNGQTTDYIANFWDGTFQLKLISPDVFPFFGLQGEQLLIQAETPVAADFQLYVNDDLVDTQNNITGYSYTYLLGVASDYAIIKLTATSGADNAEAIFQIILSRQSLAVVKPSGIIPGINYHEGDKSKATLCLWAPLKTSVYVLGDFNNWEIQSEYLMHKDGEHFWFEITGLEEGEEYAFQYLVDETVYVADPFADKILDPDDQDIPSETYPNLKPFPTLAVKPQWYYNRAAVLQTGQKDYAWQTQDFEKPPKEKLIIYELLIRDFFTQGEQNYQNLIDTLSYLKKLGVNAIELMPVTEFNGNESWGYNPAFMFAPDKYYGTKNKLKEFIDRCHAEGIAVILDVVMNQQDIPNPFVLMYYDFGTGKPTQESPWFNQNATHPFNVFYDLNHESLYTQQYLDTVNHYWIHEYNFDGYRFDLSKGFTQKNANGNVAAWGEYDASRIAILKRMADKIWEHTPDAYVILEHFADNKEEKELAEYKSEEGKGMLLWGNYNGAYSQLALGNSADFGSVYHSNRDWTVPHLIGYMESHDEERLMYRNLQNGRSAGAYNVKNLSTALERIKAASLMLFSIPGPKMLWQFGELGYDQSINRCEDGAIDENCRVSPKPVHWDYRENAERYDVYSHLAELVNLRNTYPVFTQGEATIQEGTSFVKQIIFRNVPYTNSPTDASQMNVTTIANFDVIAHTSLLDFPHTGAWFEFYTGQTISVSGSSFSITLRPGEYQLYTDFPIKDPVTGVAETPSDRFTIYPNPVQDDFTVEDINIKTVKLYTPEGKELPLKKRTDSTWSTHGVAPGFYIVQIKTRHGIRQSKIIKQ